MRTKKLGMMLFIGVFAVIVVFAVPAYSILHGETTIPQLQRYTDSFPWQKGGLSSVLIAVCFIVLFSPIVYDKIRTSARNFNGIRFPLYSGRYRIRIVGRWFNAKLFVDRVDDDE